MSDTGISLEAGQMSPLLGGGTRLMFALKHRISHDIDLFVRDPQYIGFLSPRLNDQVGEIIQGYEEDATLLKLKFSEGEIDIIVRMSLTGLPPESSAQSLFKLEPVEEVLTKKLFYRGAFLKPRDLFDWNCIEIISPETLDMKRLSRIISSKLDGIFQALERMKSNPFLKREWDLIETPLELDFDKTVSWGKERLEIMRDIGLSADADEISHPE
ncbi:MAG: nucleotidyl transferase AbiEii/AbiGii toxin family protein [Nitrospiraceae bacterium]|nr:nucleotidyl transferase AbiEii/AbiGii toxin family protein [Nitrospiraceae bacterium]